MIKNTFYLFAIILLFFFKCESSKKSVDQLGGRNSKKTVTVPSFNSDSAYQFIRKQVEFGPRVPNTYEHKACGEFLVKKLISYGAKVQEQQFSEQAYNGTILHLKNIIASYNPDAKKQ